LSTNVKNAKNGTTYPPLEAGTYPAVCCGVIDLGLQRSVFEGNEKELVQILLTWEIPDETIEVNGETKPRQISRTYTFSVNEKARLRKDLKAWRGRDFTDVELADFDIAKVLGAPCFVNITNVTRNGTTYANLEGIMKLPKGMAVKPPTKRLHFDIDNRETWGVFHELPEWVQTKINESLTFQEKGFHLDRAGNIEPNPPAALDKDYISGMCDICDDDEPLPF